MVGLTKISEIVPEVHVGGVMKPETHIFLFGLETIDTSRNLI
jgi:hypothetical protein